ncbi:MAG: nicotinate (nicotinamide) nucleotide adenylyltransferase [Candidatus Izemoplasmatales bacterium]|jgi:nicotinate-nucleotide adenylyltransferase|nr:nicotinate (nicotinamide) nucleotide adenylyltransferase [Candidatus Izemoplasmatales bacterium]
MVVVFGGAFNPPTLAHKEIYHLIDKVIGFDHFIFLPVSNKYNKSTLIPDNYRIDMLNILIKELPKASLSLLEIDDRNYLGTYESLKRLREFYPDKEISFIIGSDNLIKIKHWINSEALIKEFKFICINRNRQDAAKIIEKDPLLNQYKDNFKIIQGFNQYISSTAFRDSLDPSYVTDEIFQYIMENDLYRGN